MKLSLLIFFISVTSQAAIPDGVFTELGKFTTEDGRTLPKDYIQKFPILIEKAVEASVKNLKMPPEGCKPIVSVEQKNAFTTDKDPMIRDFEGGIIRIEVVACLPKVDSSLVLKALASPYFRKTTISTIQKTYQQNGNFCEITQAPTIGSSNYCFEIQSSLNENISKATSYKIWNSAARETYNVPVYYRGVFETSVQTETQTVYHMISYIRANKFNLMQRMFVGNYIVSVEDVVLKQLAADLK